MPAKSHQTALVAIPPPQVWPPIQAIRQRHDRQFRRWMPHITLLYPFRPPADFAALAPRLAKVCAAAAPLTLCLGHFRHFAHRNQRYTLWLAPEPAAGLSQVQSQVQQIVPDCNDTSRFPKGFTPHLSVGQAQGLEEAQTLATHWQSRWSPLEFIQTELALISRGQPPDDIFRVVTRLPLGPL